MRRCCEGLGDRGGKRTPPTALKRSAVVSLHGRIALSQFKRIGMLWRRPAVIVAYAPADDRAVRRWQTQLVVRLATGDPDSVVRADSAVAKSSAPARIRAIIRCARARQFADQRVSSDSAAGKHRQ